MYSKIILKKGKEVSVKRFHKWIYSGAVDKIIGKIAEGDIVEIYDANNNFLAIGHYQSESITVRILSFEKTEIDQNFWNKKIDNAIELRKKSGFFTDNSTNVFRLINGEGDDMPGLIADYYDGLVVTQCFSAGMYKNINQIAEAISSKTEIKAIYDKSSLKLPQSYKKKIKDGFIKGEINSPVEVSENNNKFLVDFIEGQKTGFFIDQRENRKILSEFSSQKEILNLYSYTGGFSIYAAKSGAQNVTSVESSELALEIAEKNYHLNNVEKIVKNEKADVEMYLKNNIKKYDIIVLDPPALAKNHLHKEKALKKYKNINEAALLSVKNRGLLFTFSCSKAITSNELKQALFIAGANTKRNLKIIKQLHQPADHPISIYNPESEHLKGFVVFVE